MCLRFLFLITCNYLIAHRVKVVNMRLGFVPWLFGRLGRFALLINDAFGTLPSSLYGERVIDFFLLIIPFTIQTERTIPAKQRQQNVEL